jgi:hypothetical protein
MNKSLSFELTFQILYRTKILWWDQLYMCLSSEQLITFTFLPVSSSCVRMSVISRPAVSRLRMNHRMTVPMMKSLESIWRIWMIANFEFSGQTQAVITWAFWHKCFILRRRLTARIPETFHLRCLNRYFLLSLDTGIPCDISETSCTKFCSSTRPVNEDSRSGLIWHSSSGLSK